MSALRVGPVVDRLLGAVGWVVLAGAFATALHDASLAWDSWYYHLPFAARIAGVIPERGFAFHAANQARFDGFALFGEVLQGALWRLTGRVEAANLVAWSSVPLLAWFLWKRWNVPFGLSTLALFAVPLVQTHAPGCYVDLPGNTAAAVVVLLAVDAWASDSPVPSKDVALAVLCGAAAANIKPLLQPLVGLALLAIVVRLVARGRDAASRRRGLWLVLGMVLASPVVLFTPLKNAIVHKNPFYPIASHPFGLSLPGPEGAYESSPPWLAHAPRPWRFLCSLLEIGVRPLSDVHRWTVDQWMPEDSMGNRMGGFCGVYVVLLLAALTLLVVRSSSRLARVSGVAFASVTALIACMPQSHELRYYMSWMLLLVSLTFGLACRGEGPRRDLWRRGLGVVALGVLGVVVASTRGAYVSAGGVSVAELVRSRVDDRPLDRLKDGERVCVRKEPFNLLWADTFHGPRRYVVQEAEEPADCGGVGEVDGGP